MTPTPSLLPETPARPPAGAAEASDLLADVLGRVQLAGAMFLCGEFSAPWALASSDGPSLCSRVQPGARRLVMFHIAVQGGFRIQLESGERAEVRQGDAVVLPYGDRHAMGDPDVVGPVPLTSLLPASPWRGIPAIRHGGSGDRARVLCGYLQCEDLLFNPVLHALPRLIHSRPSSPAAAQWREASLRYCVDKVSDPEARRERWLQRLPELLLVDCLRQYADSLQGQPGGWLGALKDPVMGRALALLHAQAAAPWTVTRLARGAAVSRSVLAERFVRTLGVPPMHYLAQWRLQLAADLLREEPPLGLAAIAERVGYESEAAFSRAFKRHLGVAPAAWRKSGQAAEVTRPRR